MATRKRKNTGMGVDPEGYVPDVSPWVKESLDQGKAAAPVPTPAIGVQRDPQFTGTLSPDSRLAVLARQQPNAPRLGTRPITQGLPRNTTPETAQERSKRLAGSRLSPVDNFNIGLDTIADSYQRGGLVGMGKDAGRNIARGAGAVGGVISDVGSRVLYGEGGVTPPTPTIAPPMAKTSVLPERVGPTPVIGPMVGPVFPDFNGLGMKTDMTEVAPGITTNNNAIVGGALVRGGGSNKVYTPDQVIRMMNAPTVAPVASGPMYGATTNAQNDAALSRFREFESRTNANAGRLTGAIAGERAEFTGPRSAMRPSKEERVAGVIGTTQRDVARINAEAAAANAAQADAFTTRKMQQESDIAKGHDKASIEAARARGEASAPDKNARRRGYMVDLYKAKADRLALIPKNEDGTPSPEYTRLARELGELERDIMDDGAGSQAIGGAEPSAQTAPTATMRDGTKLVLKNGQWVKA